MDMSPSLRVQVDAAQHSKDKDSAFNRQSPFLETKRFKGFYFQLEPFEPAYMAT
jgi:hypothetical protein